MPPRLFAPSAFCASSSRAFSSTTARSVSPRKYSPSSSYLSSSSSSSSSPSSSASSSSDLLSIGSSRNNRNYNYNNNNTSSSNRSNDKSSSTSAAGESAARIIDRFHSYDTQKRMAESMLKSKMDTLETMRNSKISNDYLKQMPRRWAAGDVYSPHDMSPVEMQKWRKRSPRKADVVDALGIRPLDMYKNFSLIQEFTSSSGQITHSSGTSLRPVNQRKIAKMIRRVQGMGLYPTIHDHPEMIRDSFFPPRR